MRDELRSVTVSVECPADRARVLRTLRDPRRLPEWAPPFADRVDPDGEDGWRVTKGDAAFALRVEEHPGAGTVDFLRELESGGEGGAFLRVVPRPGGGSVIAMTAPVPAGVDPVQARTNLRTELGALRDLLEEEAGR